MKRRKRPGGLGSRNETTGAVKERTGISRCYRRKDLRVYEPSWVVWTCVGIWCFGALVAIAFIAWVKLF